MRKKIYFVGGGVNEFNSIFIQEKLLANFLEDIFTIIPVFIKHVNCSEINSLLERKEIILWQYGSFIKELLFIKDISRIIFIYHNITPAKYFIGSEPLVAFKAFIGRIQLSLLSKKVQWIAASEYNKNELLNFGFTKVKYCPNIISYTDGSVYSKTEYISLLYVGRLVQNKNCIMMLEEIQKVASKLGQHIVFNVVGNGKEKSRYFKRINGLIKQMATHKYLRIVVHSKVDKKKLDLLYKQSWLYVNFSRHEGFGVPSCESILNGTPALYLSSGGQESVLDNIGLVNEDEICDTICAYLSNKKMLSSLLLSQRKVVELYIYPNVESKIKEVYSPLLFH